jgi:hypothetical protein
VFENTVDEKIIEKAEIKWEAGQLAEQKSNLNKDEMVNMIRHGASHILQCTIITDQAVGNSHAEARAGQALTRALG